MTNNMKIKRIFLLSLIISIGGIMTGCSIVGKRQTSEGWQVSLLNGREFESDEAVYYIAIYDAHLPQQDSMSILQLWSGGSSKPSEKSQP